MIGYLRDYTNKLENIGDQPELSRILGELITSFSRGATKVVAASDSLESSKQAADYICDGVDDQVQIQAAIDALPSVGGEVILLEGNFNSAQIIIPSNTVFGGLGAGTKLKLNDGINNRFIVNSDRIDGNSNIIMKNIYIDGNKDGQTELGPSDDFGNAGCLDFRSVNNLVIQNCIIENGWAAGIETTLCENVIITGNRINNSGDDGIGVNDQTFYATVSNNIITNAGQGKTWGAPCGIEIQDGAHDFSITGNIIRNSLNDGIQVSTHAAGTLCYQGIISNNAIQSCLASGIQISGVSGQVAYDITIMGNVIDGHVADADNCYYGIFFASHTKRCIAIGNIISNTRGHGILVRGPDFIVEGNTIYDNVDNGINLYSDSANTLAIRNILKNNSIQILDNGINNIVYERYSDFFMDVLAVSATHIRSNENLSAATPITFTIDAQPDAPRTLSGHFDSHAQITEYDIEIIGVDAKGNTITETKDETDGWDWETSNAFATITSIKMTARTGTGAADTMDIGITDVLGLSNKVYATGDVFKIKKNNANATVVEGDVDITYDTYDMHTITLGATDDFTIWYKSNLNLIS